MYKNYKTLFKLFRSVDYPIGLDFYEANGSFYFVLYFLKPLYVCDSPMSLKLCGLKVCRLQNSTLAPDLQRLSQLRTWVWKTAREKVFKLLKSNFGLLYVDSYAMECNGIDDYFLDCWRKSLDENYAVESGLI